ncbi:MAG: c-type cytochrome [Phycisphaera sp.]|nr:c-type cytochrome [Phycisphaera sp.]
MIRSNGLPDRVSATVWVWALITMLAGAGLAWAGFPNRAAFVASHPKAEGVPVDAFEFDDSASDLDISVWATSPQLFTPVAMDIDPQGRAWVVEGVDYGRGRTLGDGTSIVVLTDTDADGRADESHVFIAEPNVRTAPLGIAVFDNKVVLSATPSVIVYTDVNRNAVFDEGDTREVFLTGFEGGGHDHTLHAVVPSPSGQWYLSCGNKGANIKTADGREFYIGCYYGNPGAIGKKSSDGHVYMGGTAFRINPDGTGLTVVGDNMRNTHDMVVSSFGDVFQNDNDDPAHARATWLQEHGNMGYADPRDGSKSWEEIAKPWEENRADEQNEPAGYVGTHGKGVIRSTASHWRENYPGTLPPGDVYGAGSPTGVTLIEGDELGAKYRGTYLACDMVHKALLGYNPTLHDAQIEMRNGREWLRLKKDQRGQFFLPTDIVVGTDGALYLADFYNDTSRHVDQVSGTIYRIAPKSGPALKRPDIKFDTIPHLFDALRNPNAGVRWVALTTLLSKGHDIVDNAKKFYTANAANPYIQARAVWLLAELGGDGRAFVEQLLSKGDESQRILAYRALRYAAPDRMLTYAAQAAKDKSPAVRREVAVSLRDVPLDKMRDVLAALIAGYDGKNRWYVEALGAAADGQETGVYKELIRPLFKSVDVAQWDDRAKNLAWRLHTPEAMDDIDRVVRAQKPDIKGFRHLIMAYALPRNEDERQQAERIVLAWAKLPEFSGDDYQLTVHEVFERDIKLIPMTHITQDYKVPASLGADTQPTTAEDVAKLNGDVERGRAKAALCLTCHRIDGNGISFGPDLSAWATQRTVAEFAKEVINPSEKLAHGFEDPVRLTARNGKVAEGFMVNYSYHAGSLKIKTMGGQFLKIPFRGDGVRIEHLKTSWMPPASKMGLTNQDLRDIAEYLKNK